MLLRCGTVVLAVAALLPAAATELTVSGRVVGPSGVGIPEADVALAEFADPVARAAAVFAGTARAPAARARTDAEGYFRLPVPQAGLWVLDVRAPGFVPLRGELTPLLESRVLPDAELAPDAGLTVRVELADGTPLPGARVRVAPEDGGRSFFRAVWRPAARDAVTDGNGTAGLARAEREASIVSISAGGLAYRELRDVRGTAVTVTLEPGALRRVVVADRAGTPVPGALVVTGRSGHPAGLTGDDGTLALFVAAEHPLRVIARDGRKAVSRIGPAAEGSPPEFPIALLPRRTLAGRLIDAESRAGIAGGLVWSADEPWNAVRTGGSGAYALRAASRGVFEIRAGATGYLPPGWIRLSGGSDRPAPTLALAPGAAIEGKVVDEHGDPVAGALLELEVKQGGGMFRISIGGNEHKPVARSDARGAFRLSPVDPDSDYDLEATAAGYAPASRAIRGLEPRRTTGGVEVMLTAGVALTGTVVDEEGRPLGDAALSAAKSQGSHGRMGIRMVGPDSAGSFEGSSGRDGAFEIAGLAPGTYDLAVQRNGYAKRKVQGIEIPGGQPTFDVGAVALTPGLRLTGTVLDFDGRPLEGAQIRLAEGGPMFMAVGASLPDADAVSGADGWFVLDELAEDDPIDLRVTRNGYVSESIGGLTVPLEDPLEVRMQPASLVEGVVVDPDGEPIAGANVNMRRTVSISFGGRMMRTVSLESTNTDDEGRFAFEEIEPGKIALIASAPGWQEFQRDNIEVPRGEDLTGVELRLSAGAVVEGRVLAPDGRPAIGASVDVVRDEAQMVRFGGSAVDGDGYYRLDGLEPGPVSIEAKHDDYPRVVRDIEARAGTSKLDLTFSGGHEVSGRVLDASGTPVPSAAVRLAVAGRWGGPEAVSEPDGSFVIRGVNDGSYALFADAEGLASSAGETTVEVAGQPVQGLEVRLERGGTLRGTVRGVDERDYGRVSIDARKTDGLGFASGTVDFEGRYELRNVLPGDWRVVGRVEKTGRRAEGSITLEPGAPDAVLDLEFGGGLTLSGRAVQSGEPIAGTMFWAEGLDVSSSGWTDTDQNGRFSLEGLEPGRYRINLRDWQTGLSYNEEIDLATSREIEIDVPIGQVRGRIVDATDRQPLAGVTITLVNADADARSVFPAHGASSDNDGRFELSNVTDGEWLIKAERKGYAAASRQVRIQSGRDVDNVELALDPTEGLTLEVRMPSGVPPEEVRAAVLDASGSAVVSGRYTTGENGRVRLSSVPAGSWQVVLGVDGAATANIEVQAPGALQAVPLSAATSLRVEIPALRGGSTLATLRIRDASGRPFRSLDWFGSPRELWRISGGVAEIRSLPAGSWSISASTSDGRSWSGTVATSAGTPAALVLE